MKSYVTYSKLTNNQMGFLK